MESSYILILVKEIKEITINHLEHVGLIELTNCNPWHMTQELANLFNKSSYWLRHSGFHWLFSMATNIWFVSRIVCISFLTLRRNWLWFMTDWSRMIAYKDDFEINDNKFEWIIFRKKTTLPVIHSIRLLLKKKIFFCYFILCIYICILVESTQK